MTKKLTFFVRSVLMTEDFPTLGYPTKPTDIACLSLFKRENCLRIERRDPWNKHPGFLTMLEAEREKDGPEGKVPKHTL